MERGIHREYRRVLEEFRDRVVKELGDKTGIIECLVNMGFCYEKLGDRRRVNEFYEEVARLCGEMRLYNQAKEYRSWIK